MHTQMTIDLRIVRLYFCSHCCHLVSIFFQISTVPSIFWLATIAASCFISFSLATLIPSDTFLRHLDLHHHLIPLNLYFCYRLLLSLNIHSNFAFCAISKHLYSFHTLHYHPLALLPGTFSHTL